MGDIYAMTCFCNGQCGLAGEAFNLLSSGKLPEAYEKAHDAILNAPNCARLNGVLGIVYLNTGRPEYAEYHFRKAREIEGDNAKVLANLGDAFQAQGKLDAALTAYEDAENIEPKFNQAILGIGKVYELEGNNGQAIPFATEGLNASPNHPFARQLMVNVNPELAETVLTGENITGPEILLRGRIRERNGDYKGAWADYVEGNRRIRENGHTYKPKLARTFADNMKLFTTRETMKALANAGAFASTPIFITGYPRSGTTMIEQALSMSDNVEAGDELRYISDIADMAPRVLMSKMPYPFCLNEIRLADRQPLFKMLRDYYINQANLGAEYELRKKTDKMPLNEVHMPLIRLLFPNAPILYVQRHPLDIIVSNFSNYLTHGHNQSFDLISCAMHYALVDELVQHYIKKWISFCVIRYEDFIKHPHVTLRTVSGYVGIEYDESMVEFNKNPRYARTASYAQVKKPLYDKSIGRYKNYLTELEPVLPIVRHIIEREGYEV